MKIIVIVAQTRSEYSCLINLVQLHPHKTRSAGGKQIGGA
jgi:hypothetical protein